MLNGDRDGEMVTEKDCVAERESDGETVGVSEKADRDVVDETEAVDEMEGDVVCDGVIFALVVASGE